jgi:hypothetical protein
MFDPKSGEPPHNLIGVFMRPSATKAFPDFAPEIGAVVNQISTNGEFVDIVDLSGVDWAGRIAKTTEPFYP